MKVTSSDLLAILASHMRYLAMEDGGVCADLRGADLSCANLRDANLRGADLRYANLSGDHVIDGGQRRDGYRFVAHVGENCMMIVAGCRYFTLSQAHTHWAATRAGTDIGNETMAILDHIERIATLRGWKLTEGTQP